MLSDVILAPRLELLLPIFYCNSTCTWPMITNEDALDIFSRRDDELDVIAPSVSAEKTLFAAKMTGNTPHVFQFVVSTANHASEAIFTPPMGREVEEGPEACASESVMCSGWGGWWVDFIATREAYSALGRDWRHKKSRWAYFVARHATGTVTFRIISDAKLENPWCEPCYVLGVPGTSHGTSAGRRAYRHSPVPTFHAAASSRIAGSIDALHLHVAYCLEEASAEHTYSHGPIKSTLCVSRGSRRSPCTLFGCIFFGSKCRQSRRRHPSPTLATSTCVTTSRREEKEKQCEHPKSFI